MRPLRHILRPAGLAALALATALPAAAAPGRARLEARVERALRERIPADGIAIEVALQDDDLPASRSGRRAAIRSRQGRALGGLPGGSFRIKHRYGSVSGFSGWARPEAIDALLAHPEVFSISFDGQVRATLQQGGALVGATAAHGFGFTGAGVRVAVLDTGIDSDHPQLLDDIAAQQCFCDNNPQPGVGCCPGGVQTGPSAEDDEGHGTSVAGIITSSHPSGPGVAPDAEVVAVKVLSGGGGGSFSDVTAGLDWVLANRVSLGIRIVNLSVGDGGQHNDSSAFPCSGTNTANAIAALHDAGVSVFVSSGNAGYDNGIEFPACVPTAIAVGGVYDAAVGGISWCGNASCTTTLCTDNPTSADQFVCHSNSDELLDLLAPDWRTDTTALGGGSRAFSGTSAASPYAAAEAALLLQADPSLTPAQIEALLESHGPMVTSPANGLSFRRADVLAALTAIAPGTCGNGSVELAEQCDDGNTASGDCCSASCHFEIAGATCTDASACTAGDRCDGSGVCVAGAALNCDDGAWCNGAESCDPLAGCRAGIPPPVDDGVACTSDGCDEVADAVLHTPVHASCDDGAFCTGVESCDTLAGCLPGIPPRIDDGVACTSDSCNEVADAVLHIPIHASCDDGAFCSGAESCDPLVGCRAGTPPPLDDGVACTSDSCDEVADAVLHTPIHASCDDGAFCSGAESCDPLAGCLAGTPPPLDDGVACTSDSCDEVADAVLHTPIHASCDDGAFCTGSESCDPLAGCLAGTPPPLDDGVACTGDSCDEVADAVLHTPIHASCDDGAFCTGVESCDTLAGCLPGIPPRVDDDIACTSDSCDEVADAILHTPIHASCDDGAFCTGSESCDPLAGCLAGTPPPLDDGVACTRDSCDEASDALLHTPDAAACDDGAFCTGAETCDAVAGCLEGAPPRVDDGVACTDDRCDELVDAIVHTPADALCDDGDECTAELCDALLGCTSTPVPGCAVRVPSSPPGFRGILGLLLAALGAGLARRRERA